MDLDKVLQFATQAHSGQKRKYTGDDYIVHPVAVAKIVKDYGGSVDQQAAALLHDVVEDCDVTIDQVRDAFGDTVADLVDWLTDVSVPSDGNRAVRKALDRAHSADAPADAQFIKLADLMDNTKSIVAHDPSFAKVYLKEKQLLLSVMTKVQDTPLFQAVSQQIS
jgi:(p)ppGpp synthase/HD superfamily hydrolase